MHWIRFNEWCASHSIRGQVRERDGVRAMWSHTTLIVHNLTAVPGPIVDAAALESAGRAAVADAAAYGLPWMFGVPAPWLPVGVEEANGILARAGLTPLMYMTVMECDGTLAAPLRALPTNVEIVRVDSRTRGFDALNLNSCAYGLPASVTDDVLDARVYFSDPEREFGFVVYDRSGAPVSTATAVDLGDWVYIAAVATDEAHRRKGYAEVALRAALQAAPRKRTALDASRMGQPLYAQMGYRPLFPWNFWVTGTEKRASE